MAGFILKVYTDVEKLTIEGEVECRSFKLKAADQAAVFDDPINKPYELVMGGCFHQRQLVNQTRKPYFSTRKAFCAILRSSFNEIYSVL